MPQTFIYYIAYFLLADGLNTTGSRARCSFEPKLNVILGQLVTIIQNDLIEFSFLQLTYLGLCQAACSIVSSFSYWYFQRHYQVSTKRMFMFLVFFSIFIPLWGMLGLWTHTIGYHNMVNTSFIHGDTDGQSGNFTFTTLSLVFSRPLIMP